MFYLFIYLFYLLSENNFEIFDGSTEHDFPARAAKVSSDLLNNFFTKYKEMLKWRAL